MISLHPIRFENLRPYIMFGFQSDPELVEHIHIIAPAELQEITDHTYQNLKLSNNANLKPGFYRVQWNEDGAEGPKKTQIGFVAVVRRPKPILISFAININYRKKEILLPWLRRVKDLFEETDTFPDGAFCVSLYEKNVRAIKFFERNGFTVNHRQDNFVLLWQSLFPQ